MFRRIANYIWDPYESRTFNLFVSLAIILGIFTILSMIILLLYHFITGNPIPGNDDYVWIPVMPVT